MATDIQPLRLAPQIGSTLSSLRRRLRAYVWAQGLAAAIIWLGAAFWITLALDWLVEPPVIVRQVMLGIAGLGLVVVLYRFLLRRLFVRIADRSLALLLERRFNRLGDSLLTSVELSRSPEHAQAFHPSLLAQTQNDAVGRLAGLNAGEVFRRGPLARSLALAAAALISIGALAVIAPRVCQIWADRMLMFSDVRWPRRTHLSIEGFDHNYLKVAKGSDLTIVVRAETRGEVPDSVQIRYRTDEGSSRENMSRVGIAGPDEKYQTYTFAFRGILSSRTFDIVGGDDRLRDYRIDVVDVPTLTMTLHCEFPPYMRHQPRDLPVSGLVQLPQGTKVTVSATANKDLVEVPIQSLSGDKAAPLDTIQLASAADRRHFTLTLPPLAQDQTLLFTLLDSDGIRSREPVRLLLGSAPDEPPRVALRLRGIGSAVTPQARLPIEGDVTDDYGVAKLWFEYKLDQAAAVQVPFRLAPKERLNLHFDRATDEALDLKDRNLKIGGQLIVAAMAQDNCALPGGANTAPGEKYQLSIVSPDELLSILEARELTLRMRLDALIQDVTDTRDRLARVDFTPARKPAAEKKLRAMIADNQERPRPDQNRPRSQMAQQPQRPQQRRQTPPAPSAPKAGDALVNKAAVPKPAAGAEPGDVDAPKSAGAEPGDENSTWAAHGLSAPPVVVEQTQANSLQSASELDSLATAFDDIREELTNNRIDTPELETRLKDQIADPLRKVAQQSFPDLDARLRRLQAVLADPAAAGPRRDEAVKQLDAILVDLRAVLNKMLELESFNEIVERLRDVIDAQDKLKAETQKQQKAKALKLEE